MENNIETNILKRSSKKLIIFEIICVLIVIGIIGYTYSFFNVTASNSTVISGEAASVNLSITVTRVSPGNNKGLVPQLDEFITSAVTGRNGSCIDDNNNNVCQVYKITVKNNGASLYVNGKIEIDAKNNPNLKWAQISGTTSPTLSSDVHAYSYTKLIQNEYYNSSQSKDYYIVLWISETGAIQTDQGGFSGVVTVGDTTSVEFISEPNSPDLVQGLIPVTYNESTSTWVKADSANTDKSWYNYDNKLWANAVLVTEANRSTYQSASVGTTIDELDILAYYVWIPRYKYKVWNISKQAGAESTYAYNAYTEGIDIEWETGTTTTGTINCEYNYNVDTLNGGIDLSTTTTETCTGSNGDYYTHPAFTFGNDNINGFWIGKYEISSSNPETGSSYGGGNTTSLTVRILPNVTSWRNITVSNINTVIQNMQTSSNIYGLSTSRTNTDSHMLTNYEWGAVAYLTNSKYGRCTDGSCTEVSINGYGETSNYTTMTGCGPISSGSTSYSTTCNAYNTTLGQLASTTGNVTGVYDMSGGAAEYVMGNMSSASGSYTFYPSNSSFASSWYTTDTAKYVTTYAYDTVYNNQTAYNRGRLGDATAETLLTASISGGWYADSAFFPYSSTSWFSRSSIFDRSSAAGLFYFNSYAGGRGYLSSSRTALVSLFA